MPKRVDHDQRRREIGHAVARIAAAEGLEAVSMRRVAAEAGMSTPLVQHYFPDKNAMLRHAVTDLTETTRRVAEARVGAVVDPRAPEHPVPLLRAILDELLPLDDDRRTVQLLHTAFFVRALGDPELAAFYRDAFPMVTGELADLLRGEQRSGRVPAALDADREIETLLVLGVGLGTEVLLGSRSTTSARQVIDYHLARLFPDVAPRHPDPGAGERNAGDPDGRPGHTGTQ